MSTIGQVLSHPTAYDADPRATFEGVGRVMSAMASMEFEFARLFSAFHGEADGDALLAYGAPGTLKQRIAKLYAVASSYFSVCPDHGIEALFIAICNEAESLARPAAEIGRGIVVETGLAVTGSAQAGVTRYAVLPAHHELDNKPAGLASYAYASRELNGLANKIETLAARISALRSSLPPPSVDLDSLVSGQSTTGDETSGA